MAKSNLTEMYPALEKAVVNLYLTTAGSYRASMPDQQRDAYIEGLATHPEADVLRAIRRIGDNPEQRGMPTLAQIKAKMPNRQGATESLGVDMIKAFAWFWAGDELTTIGDPGTVPDPLSIVVHAKRAGGPWLELGEVLGVSADQVAAAEVVVDSRVEPVDPYA